ncbi:hypothetical protein L6241_15340 [Janibacter sp. Y6]|uniref:hypothetical protein n=1 Tax=Janibacter sp. Y6 TaxID=2913552 RepID=UPI0034A58F94
MAKHIPKDRTGLSLGYRLLWRSRYVLYTFFGPATQSGMRDPHYRMRAERLERVNAARAVQGLEPLEDVDPRTR